MKAKFVLFLVLLILLINGCSSVRYNGNRDTLKNVKITENDVSRYFIETIDDVTLSVKSLSGKESEYLFDTNLVRKGYIPIYLHINNRTNQTLILRKSYLNLNLCTAQEVSKQMHYNTSLYGWGLGLPAFWFYWPAALAVGAMSYNMSSSNQDANARIEECTYHDNELKIMPYESISKFIFVNKLDYQYNFDINLFNINQQKLITFSVNLIDSDLTN